MYTLTGNELAVGFLPAGDMEARIRYIYSFVLFLLQSNKRQIPLPLHDGD